MEDDLIKVIVGVFYDVYNALGSGFLEKVYENAIANEFEKVGVKFRRQCPIKIGFRGQIIGDYVADFLVDERVIVEIKAKGELSSVDDAQLLNYLKATGVRHGVLFNFGKEPRFKKMVLSR